VHPRLVKPLRLVLALLLAPAVLVGGVAAAGEPARLTRDGGVRIAGRQVRCDDVTTRLDRRLPNLGAAAPVSRLLLLNPLRLGRETDVVQLFVFHHECGHHQVGASEIEADCWAVKAGVGGGWLDRGGLNEVCGSFHDAPETRTHPSGKRRCAALERCFAAASGATRLAQTKAPPSAQAKSGEVRGAYASTATTSAVPVRERTRVASLAPRLVAGPVLVRTGTSR
jgi:hypothetical protein